MNKNEIKRNIKIEIIMNILAIGYKIIIVILKNSDLKNIDKYSNSK